MRRDPGGDDAADRAESGTVPGSPLGEAFSWLHSVEKMDGGVTNPLFGWLSRTCTSNRSTSPASPASAAPSAPGEESSFLYKRAAPRKPVEYSGRLSSLWQLVESAVAVAPQSASLVGGEARLWVLAALRTIEERLSLQRQHAVLLSPCQDRSCHAFQHSGLHMDTDRQPQGGSPYGSSTYDSFNGSPRVMPAAVASQHGMPPLDLSHSSLSRKARVEPTSDGSLQPASPNLVRLPPLPWLTGTHAHTRTSSGRDGVEITNTHRNLNPHPTTRDQRRTSGGARARRARRPPWHLRRGRQPCAWLQRRTRPSRRGSMNSPRSQHCRCGHPPL